MNERTVLKKYANRRLYDTQRSRYVTLDDVAEMIRGGEQVQIADAKTGEDVTAFILTQIVLEKAKTRHFLLPAPLLHLIIQYGDNVLEEFFNQYLELTINNYLSYKSTMDQQFRKWLNIGADLSGIAQKSLSSLSPFSALFKSPAPKNEPGDK